MQNEVGTIYVIVFDPPVSGRIRTYTGWARNLEGRFHYHLMGKGAALTAEAVRQGVSMRIAWTAPGTRADERRLKNRKNMPKFLKKQGIVV